MYAFTPDFGRSFLLKSFCIIVLAGMESVAGVAAGAFVLALLENVVGGYTSLPTSFQDALSFTRASLQPSGAAADRVMNRIRYSSGWSIPKWT